MNFSQRNKKPKKKPKICDTCKGTGEVSLSWCKPVFGKELVWEGFGRESVCSDKSTLRKHGPERFGTLAGCDFGNARAPRGE